MNRWRIKKDSFGFWVTTGPYGTFRQEETFADAIGWVDRHLRKVPVVLEPSYRRDPEIHWIGPGAETALVILEDRENAALVGGTQPGFSALTRFPVTLLPELARAALTLYSQYLAATERAGSFEEVSLDD